MVDSIIGLITNMPHWLGTILLSMIPVAELRLAIPLAITTFGINPVHAFILCCIGNLIPVPFIILFVRPIFAWMKKFGFLRKIVEKLEAKGEAKKDRILKYEFWGLFLFVAIPLPGTGAWTGALVASMLDMRLKNSLPSITLGVMGAGLIMTLATTGVLKIFGI